MNLKFTKPIEIKSIDEKGSFTGYAATFGNIDLGDDVIIKGAFSEWLSSIGDDLPSVCWQHQMHNPIGITTKMYEDDYGLYVEGLLTLGVKQADDARLLSKSGAVKGLSIGYRMPSLLYSLSCIR